MKGRGEARARDATRRREKPFLSDVIKEPFARDRVV
jgi:hypothetical protein